MRRYHLDLSALPLDWLRSKIENHELVPARRMLQERINERFGILHEAGIATVDELVRALRGRSQIESFAVRTGLPSDYLLWLLREAKSYRPNPFALRDIPGVDSHLLEALDSVGIGTTKALFDRAAGRVDRESLAEETHVSPSALLSLVRLADLARIRGMGKTFVCLFAATGADSVARLATEDPVVLHERLHATNRERALSSVVPSLKDVAEYVEMANELSHDLEI